MNKFFKQIILPVLVGALFFQSCKEGDKPVDFVLENTTRGATLRTMQTISPSYDLLDPNSVFSVLLEYRDNEQGALLQSYTAYVRYIDNNDDGNDIGTPEVQFDLINRADFTNGPNNFPQHTYEAVLSEVLSALGIDFEDTNAGDQVFFRMELNLTDGRTFTNNASGNVSGGSFFSSPFQYAANLACASDIGGTFDYVSTNLQAGYGSPCPTEPITGQVTWTDQGGGNYLSSDLGFGQYGSSCWGDSPATSAGAIIIDVCNEINPGGVGGLDQYGLTYIYTITQVDGADLYISWENDYADSGDVVLTRTDGSVWPPLFTSN